jgi:hypothetical protein
MNPLSHSDFLARVGGRLRPETPSSAAVGSARSRGRMNRPDKLQRSDFRLIFEF